MKSILDNFPSAGLLNKELQALAEALERENGFNTELSEQDFFQCALNVVFFLSVLVRDFSTTSNEAIDTNGALRLAIRLSATDAAIEFFERECEFVKDGEQTMPELLDLVKGTASAVELGNGFIDKLEKISGQRIGSLTGEQKR